MKKMYKKPTMESEVFVTNYAATPCLLVTCMLPSHDETMIIHYTPTEADDDKDEFYFNRNGLLGWGWWYTGDGLGNKFENIPHHVTITDAANDDHPNHS